MTIMTISRTTIRRLAAPAAMAAALTGCELDVTNPGPIQADQLDVPTALNSVVNGAGRETAEGLNWIAYTGAAVAREVFPAGSTGSFGITVLWQDGKLTADEGDDHWNRAQRARWTAENAVSRTKAALGTAYPMDPVAVRELLIHRLRERATPLPELFDWRADAVFDRPLYCPLNWRV